jgi:hypothetical protein
VKNKWLVKTQTTDKEAMVRLSTHHNQKQKKAAKWFVKTRTTDRIKRGVDESW